MSKRIIRKVAVLGSGVMGSRIACHFAGISIVVLLLDIAPLPPEGGTSVESSQLIDNCLHLCLQLTANLAILINPFLPTTAKKNAVPDESG